MKHASMMQGYMMRVSMLLYMMHISMMRVYMMDISMKIHVCIYGSSIYAIYDSWIHASWIHIDTPIYDASI